MARRRCPESRKPVALISYRRITRTRKGPPFAVCSGCKREVPVWREGGWSGRGPWQTKLHYVLLNDGTACDG